MKLFNKNPRTKSISRQTSLLLFIITFLIFLITELLILERSYSALLNAHDVSLRTQAESLASLTDLENYGTLDFDFDSQIALEYSGSDSRSMSYFLILDFENNAETKRSNSLGEIPLKIPQAVTHHEFKKIYYWTDYLKDSKVRFAAYREEIKPDPEDVAKSHAEARSHEYIFIVGRDLKNLNKQFINIFKVTSVSLTIGLIILLLSENFILLKNLKPLRDFKDEVNNISYTNLTPVSVPAVAEIAVIAQTLNKVILELNESFSRERLFTANVAHELRTPITEIRTLTEVVLSFPNRLDEKDLQNYTDILNSIKQMGNIVNNLLILTRLDSNALAFEKTRLDLNTLITGTWGRYEDKTGLKNISLIKNIPDPFIIYSDPEMFRRIADNLISNSVEYSPHDSSVEIRAIYDLDHFHLSFSNCVTNLTSSDVPMIFDRFWRKDEARTPDCNHCGLGLSIVKSLVEFLGFEIETDLNDMNQFRIIISGSQNSE
jgi:signal transduction histidine kinase